MEDSIWNKRISAANKYYQAWESKFKCKILEKFYEGFQWENIPDSYFPYTINEFYGIIKIKTAHYLFSRPHFLVSPKPGNSDYNLEGASSSAQLKEDVLNTIVDDPNVKFKQEIRLAFLDSIFRFGIMEVGYAADWIANPRAGKPLYKSQLTNDQILFGKDRIVREPDELPAHERIYFKRIHAKRFRIGGVDASYLENCSWVGYWDWVYREDIQNAKGLKNVDKLLGTAVPYITDDYDDFASLQGEDENIIKGGNTVKVWHIWDIRAKNRLLVLDSPCGILREAPYKRLPFGDFRWDVRTHGWYPIPPAFQWISPQVELNEAREQLRCHRRRFTRKYQVLRDSVDPDEKEKLMNGPDGTYVEVNRPGAIAPIEDANNNLSVRDSFVVSAEDMQKISGTASEMVQGDRQTATETNIVNTRASIREDYEASDVQDWICLLAREALILAQEKLVSGIWVKLTSDTVDFMAEFKENAEKFRYVTSDDMADGYDFRIVVDITSLSPIKAQEEKRKFIEFLSIMAQFPTISLDPDLVREAAYRVGYRNEKVIKKMQQVALLNMLGQANQAGMQMGQQGGPVAEQITNQVAPSDTADIQNQIKNQLVQ